MGEVRSPEDQWPGASSAGSVRCGDVTQQTGYPEAALARVLALTVGTGRRRGGLGGAVPGRWGRDHCPVQLQGNCLLDAAVQGIGPGPWQGDLRLESCVPGVEEG